MVVNLTILILGTLLAYLFGSLSGAVIICKLFGLPDPRTAGSNNPGATNVLRIGGKLPAFLTLLFDIAKGFVPVLAVKFFTDNPWVISAVLLAAILGHLYPVFFRFKGGKGVATLIGGLLALSPTLGAIFIFVWLGIFILTRLSSLSALTAVVTMPFWAYGFMDKRYVVVLALLAVVIVWKHQQNIKNLLAGTEKKSTFKRI